MGSWAELEANAPEIAAAGRRLLPEVSYLATAMPYDDADERHLLYEFILRRALWTTWENFQKPGMRPVHKVWRATVKK